MPLSLTPHPDSEAEDLDTELCGAFVMMACREHGVDHAEFEGQRSTRGQRATLKELRDWLGY